jgi:hypothetical protein
MAFFMSQRVANGSKEFQRVTEIPGKSLRQTCDMKGRDM